MPRFHFVPALVVLAGAVLFPFAAKAAASPAPSPVAVETPLCAKNAGTIEGVVTGVTVSPGKSSAMVVKSGGQSITFAVYAGVNVIVGKAGQPGDFAVDVTSGSHVSVSASKCGTSYTAQTVVVIPSAPHAGH
jgi:hypothetical protein